jgi:hypothetical protein
MQKLRTLVFRAAATFLCVLLTYITFAWTGICPSSRPGPPRRVGAWCA